MTDEPTVARGGIDLPVDSHRRFDSRDVPHALTVPVSVEGVGGWAAKGALQDSGNAPRVASTADEFDLRRLWTSWLQVTWP